MQELTKSVEPHMRDMVTLKTVWCLGKEAIQTEECWIDSIYCPLGIRPNNIGK